MKIVAINVAIGIMTCLTAGLGYAEDAFEKAHADFACDVDTGPLSDEEKQRYGSVEGLTALGRGDDGQENIDRLYARLTAGPIPSGFYNGNIIPANNPQNQKIAKFLRGLGLPVEIINSGAALRFVGESLWEGKIFKPDPLAAENSPSAILANRMPRTSLRNFFALFNLPLPSTQARNQWRFPAKVFCGQSLFDGRRESVVVDYAHTETVRDPDPNIETKIVYERELDHLAGRQMLNIRDEVRMVRPGFYLGRAYMGRVFVLNFTLECRDDQCQRESREDCSIGTQRSAPMAGGECRSLLSFRR